MLSTEGPKLAVGDVNGDGLEDFFMGGATGDTAKLFIQQPDGRFIQKQQFSFVQNKDNEDVGAVFFDADNDGDLDLIVVSGGNQEKQGSMNLLTRLYINDGKGNFSHAQKGWPLISVNASCVAVHDFDGDGNADIFIGARSVPGSYGLIPSSVLLKGNGKGSFENITAGIAPALLKLGMVTDAQWADIDGDGKKELVVVGDYMPLTILKYENGKLNKYKEVPASSGWWNCLKIADMNGDGHLDIIAGNNGLNSKIKANKEQPSKLYVADFDQNGQMECVPTYYKPDGKEYPWHLRGDLVAQIPTLKKKFLRYDAYAGKTISEVFSQDQLKQALQLSVEQTQSCIFYNDGKGNFDMQPLPLQAQLAPVFGILVTDINGDGINDLIMGGNFYGLKPDIGRLDASYGVTLMGTSNNSFNFLPPKESGFFIQGEIRDIKSIATKNGNYVLVARNNDALQIFKK